MKRRSALPRSRGFTAVELLIVILIIGLLAFFLLTALSKSNTRSSRINCISSVKQIGLAFRILQAGSPYTFGWTETIHTNQGNIGLVDGSAGPTTTASLRKQLADPSNATNRLAIP